MSQHWVQKDYHRLRPEHPLWIVRSLQALQAPNPRKVSRRVFWGVCKKVLKNTRTSFKNIQKWTSGGIFLLISSRALQTPKEDSTWDFFAMTGLENPESHWDSYRAPQLNYTHLSNLFEVIHFLITLTLTPSNFLGIRLWSVTNYVGLMAPVFCLDAWNHRPLNGPF